MFLYEGHLACLGGPLGKVLATQTQGLEFSPQSSCYRAECGASTVALVLFEESSKSEDLLGSQPSVLSTL